MRVALYGGSFNPPHVGHALVAGWLTLVDLVDEVWLTPTFAHAFHKELAPFDARLAMCEALASVVPRVRVCDVERHLPVPSYSVDTLNHLASEHPSRRFRIVVGSDVVPQLPRWKRWDVIEARYRPIVVGRQGYPCPDGAIAFPAVSSTDIRARLAGGRDVDHLVPGAVRAVLGDIYRSGPKAM